MPKFVNVAGMVEAVGETLLGLSAAAFTGVVWLSVAGFWPAPQSVAATAPAATPQTTARVELPTVVVVGKRDALADMQLASTSNAGQRPQSVFKTRAAAAE
jgi:hypothetical protein